RVLPYTFVRQILCVFMLFYVFFFQAEDGIRDDLVTGVQTCALPILYASACEAGMDSGDTAPIYQNDVFGLASAFLDQGVSAFIRSEERRVGKECRSRGWVYQ